MLRNCSVVETTLLVKVGVVAVIRNSWVDR